MLTPDERYNNQEQAQTWWQRTAPKSFGLLPKPETEEQKLQRQDINRTLARSGRIGCSCAVCKEKRRREHTIIIVQEDLAFCTTCKGGEGDLTTECCGRPITEEESHQIYNLGTLDFIDGKWKVKDDL